MVNGKEPEIGDVFTVILPERTYVLRIEGIVPNDMALFTPDFIEEVKRRIV